MKGIQALMKQAQEMQKKMEAMQEEMAAKEYEGVSGGGLVKVVLSGKHEVKKITIDSSLFSEDDKEVVEDLIVAAFNDALHKLNNDAQGAMSDFSSGFALPPGMKLPF